MPRAANALVALLAALWLAGPVAAHGYKLGEIAIGHIWAPPAAPGASVAPVYGAFLNRGSGEVRLVGISTPVAAEAKLRTPTMQWPKALVLAPGKPVAMSARHTHILLVGLSRPLEIGERFPLTLDFGAAGHVDVEVAVEEQPGD